MLLATNYHRDTRLATAPKGNGRRASRSLAQVAYYELTAYIAIVSSALFGQENQTPSTLWTRSQGPQRGGKIAFVGFDGLISGFKNETLAAINQIALSLLTNPNRGLNVFLRDVTVAIGGF